MRSVGCLSPLPLLLPADGGGVGVRGGGRVAGQKNPKIGGAFFGGGLHRGYIGVTYPHTGRRAFPQP